MVTATVDHAYFVAIGGALAPRIFGMVTTLIIPLTY